MNKKLSTRGERSGNGLVESARGGDGLGLPDYEFWEGLGESSKSLLGRIVDTMAERPISELAVIVAQIGLIILAQTSSRPVAAVCHRLRGSSPSWSLP